MTQAAMWTAPEDKARRAKQSDKMLVALERAQHLSLSVGISQWVDRDELERIAGSKNFTARISELRAAGWIIENRREGDKSFYRCLGKAEESTVQVRRHCETCSCQ